MRGRIRKLIQPILWKGYRWYLNKTRWYYYDGLKVCIQPSVFHPGLLGTTRVLLDFISKMHLEGKRVLELGAGSGLLALWCSRAGAITSASDINAAAIESMQKSAEANQLSLQLYHSDLFDQIPKQGFDFILINPPFYPRVPQNDRERAFFCGSDFEYFQRLFAEIQDYIAPGGTAYMILTDDCDLLRIHQLASGHGIQFIQRETKKVLGETQMIFELMV